MIRARRLLSLATWMSFAQLAQANTLTLGIASVESSSENTGASAILVMAFEQSAGDDLLTIQIQNTTPLTIGSTITAIGLELPETLNTATSFAADGTSSYFTHLTFNTPVSPDWLNAAGGYDVMITSDGKFQGGNSHGGVAAGGSQTVILNLGSTGMTSAEVKQTFADYYAHSDSYIAVARFQAVGPEASFSDSIATNVPEPSAIAIFAMGAIAIRKERRRPYQAA